MISNIQRLSTVLTPPPPDSKAQKPTITSKNIPRPGSSWMPHSSAQSLAQFVKQQDIEWLQAKQQQNLVLQHARDSVMRYLEKNADGQYTTTWAKAPTQKMIKKMSM